MGSSFIKLPVTSVTGCLEYQGTWNANTNSPTLASGVGNRNEYYVVSVAGTTTLDGISSWAVGDWAIYNGAAWQKIDNSTAVSSVFGRVGAVVAATNDYTWAQIDKTTSSLADITTRSAGDLSSGTLLDARVAQSNVTQHEAAIDHDNLTNTHNLTTDIDHNSLTNTHNLTTDIDHDQLTNFVSNEHIDWTSTSSNFNTSGTLTVTGSSSLDGLVVINDGGGAAADLRVESNLNQNMLFVDAGVDRVGIGTGSVASTFHVYENTTATDATIGITVEQDGTGDCAIQYLLSGVVRYVTGIDNDDADKFKIGRGAGWATAANIVIDTSNNVGIGTSTPSEALDVNGRIVEQGTFAEIYVADAAVQQSIPTGVTYEKLTGFTTNGQSSNCTADVSNDKITITKTGIYRVDGSFNFLSGTANVTWRGAAFLNGVEQNNIHWKRKAATSTDSGSASFTGFIDVTTVPWDLDVRVRHDQPGSINITPEYMNLNVEYCGKT